MTIKIIKICLISLITCCAMFPTIAFGQEPSDNGYDFSDEESTQTEIDWQNQASRPGFDFTNDDYTSDQQYSAEEEYLLNRSLKESTFDVSKYLRLQGQSAQPMGYFKDTNNPPVISFIFSIISYALMVMGMIAVIVLIIGGFIFITSDGNQQSIDKGKDTIKYAVLGIIVALMSYLIVNFVQSLFNV